MAEARWPRLDGRTVMLLEDESLVSLLAEDILTEAGCSVLLAMRLDEGLRMASSSDFDLAVLDVNLGGGETSFPVAQHLLGRGIPFIFATGYGAMGLQGQFKGCAVVQKPYGPGELLGAASDCLVAVRPAS